MPQTLSDELRHKIVDAGQGHILRFYDKGMVPEGEIDSFIAQISNIDYTYVNAIFKETIADSLIKRSNFPKIEPIPDIFSTIDAPKDELNKLRDIGTSAMHRGELACLVMAGGQGTRLGYDHPKGLYNIGLPSNKSLFQLISERIISVQNIIAKQYNKSAVIPLIVMTSPMTHTETLPYFDTNHYFGLKKEQVLFFCQGVLPCYDNDGKIILDAPGHVAQSPNGNGGIYLGLYDGGIINYCEKNNIKYIHVFGVDNAVMKVPDPEFLGYLIQTNGEVGCKACPKSCPTESVGNLCTIDGKYSIIEYVEMDKEVASKINPSTGKPYFNAGFICNILYTLDFLKNKCNPSSLPKVYHLANKKVPYCNDEGILVKPTSNNGIKLESFIFDVFPNISRLATFEVDRNIEFSPVKNPPGDRTDSPDTAREIISNLHKSWMKSVGIELAGEGICEISPLVSFNGEGLELFNEAARNGSNKLLLPAYICLYSECNVSSDEIFYKNIHHNNVNNLHYYYIK